MLYRYDSLTWKTLLVQLLVWHRRKLRQEWQQDESKVERLSWQINELELVSGRGSLCGSQFSDSDELGQYITSYYNWFSGSNDDKGVDEDDSEDHSEDNDEDKDENNDEDSSEDEDEDDNNEDSSEDDDQDDNDEDSSEDDDGNDSDGDDDDENDSDGNDDDESDNDGDDDLVCYTCNTQHREAKHLHAMFKATAQSELRSPIPPQQGRPTKKQVRSSMQKVRPISMGRGRPTQKQVRPPMRKVPPISMG